MPDVVPSPETIVTVSQNELLKQGLLGLAVLVMGFIIWYLYSELGKSRKDCAGTVKECDERLRTSYEVRLIEQRDILQTIARSSEAQGVLARTVEERTGRLSELVALVQGFTSMHNEQLVLNRMRQEQILRLLGSREPPPSSDRGL